MAMSPRISHNFAVNARTARLAGRIITPALLAAAALSLPHDAGAAKRVTLTLQGSITAVCAITGTASDGLSAGLGDVTRPGSKETDYTINCNTPFRYRLVSQNGALRHEAALSAPAGFAAAVPYQVAVVIPTDDVTIRDTCASESIKAGQVTCPFSDSRNGVAIDGRAKVTMAWGAQSMPIAGAYSDRLTFTVVAKP